MDKKGKKEKYFQKEKEHNKIKDIKPKKEENESKEPISIQRKMRWIIFIILITVYIVISMDQGILSSTTTQLMEDFGMSERELGGFGSMSSLGSSLGCICSFTLINKFNRKYLLLSSICFDVLCLFFTTQTSNIILLYVCRTIAGLSQNFVSVYLPVWSDQFGVHKYKSIMISIIHLSSSIGYLFGYISGMLIGWENSFYLQNILIISHMLVIFVLLPDKYFSMTLMPLKARQQFSNLNKKENKVEENQEEENKEDEIIVNKINDIDVDINDENYKENQHLIGNKKEVLKEEDNESLFEDIQIVNNEDIRKESILVHLKVLIKSPIYLLMNTTLTSVFLIVAAVQFWINDYLENCLSIKNKNTRLYSFSAVVITSPPAGIMLGGILMGKLGGYDTEKAIYLPIIASFFVSVLANIAPLVTKIYFFFPIFWFYLFFGSLLLPVARGIVLVSIPRKYGGPANAVSNLIYSIIGRLPGPNLYAFYKSKFDKDSRIPFWLLLNTAIIGFISALCCLKFQKEKYRKLNQGNDEDEDEEEKIVIEEKDENEIKNEEQEINDEK
jgi:predicted MFS family arabinose efflux permease